MAAFVFNLLGDGNNEEDEDEDEEFEDGGEEVVDERRSLDMDIFDELRDVDDKKDRDGEVVLKLLPEDAVQRLDVRDGANESVTSVKHFQSFEAVDVLL